MEAEDGTGQDDLAVVTDFLPFGRAKTRMRVCDHDGRDTVPALVLRVEILEEFGFRFPGLQEETRVEGTDDGFFEVGGGQGQSIVVGGQPMCSRVYSSVYNDRSCIRSID